MTKTLNITIVVLIIFLLFGIYFLVVNSLGTDLGNPVKKAQTKTNTVTVKTGLPAAMRLETEAAPTQSQAEIADFKSRLTDSEQARDKMAKMLEDKTKDMNNAENALQEEIANGKNREAELELQRTSLEEQVSKLTVELNETQAQFLSLKENSMNEPESELGRKVKLLKRELLTQEKKLTNITDLYNHLKDELKGFAGIINKKDEVLAAKNKEIESLKTQIDELEKNQATLIGENDPQKEKASELKKQVEVILQTQQ